MTGPILEFLDEWGTENLDMVDIREIANPKTTKVFVNGNWVGVHRDPEDLISEFTDLMQYPLFCIFSTLMFFFAEIIVFSSNLFFFTNPFFLPLPSSPYFSSFFALPPSPIPSSPFFSHSCRSIKGAETKG